ncbi:hypothetical protein GOV14_02235 [Candidatus Pacearchaeota archaeon]|nr:hypothetical protein [Candidatus Pacearchaeota archaeon]
MKKSVRRGLAAIILTCGVLVSGCGSEGYSTFSNSPRRPSNPTKQLPKADIINSPYKSTYIERAKSLAEYPLCDKKIAAAEIYGDLGMLKEMDEVLQQVIGNETTKNSMAIQCDSIRQYYYKKHKPAPEKEKIAGN